MSLPLKLFITLIIFPALIITGYFFFTSENKDFVSEKYIPINPLEISAYKQIGVVTKYDRSNGYYAGGNPPENSGVCSDVVIRALRDAYDFDLQEKIYLDMKKFPEKYTDTPDKNINHRRVKNILVYFKNNQKFLELTSVFNPEISGNSDAWKAGDIVTYKQIPGRLWHIGIVSGQKNRNGVPMLIDNHGYGTHVRISLLDWDSEISGHFRFIGK